MKSVLATSVLLLSLFYNSKAQMADRPTISSGGDHVLVAPSVYFQTTVGEVITQTLQFGSIMLTEGFQQAEQVINIPIGNGGAQLIIYPNPAPEQAKIRFNLDAPAWIDFVLINNAGQIMYQTEQQFNAGPQEIPFDFKVAPGVYLLVLRFDGRIISTKVIVE